MTMYPSLETPFRQQQVLKVISGLKNFDRAKVAQVIKAATAGGATFVDIAADPKLVKMAKEMSNGHPQAPSSHGGVRMTSLPICVSAVDPELFVSCVEAGADLIEIGNFDSFYIEGRRFEGAEVLALTQQTRQLLPDITLSVTVPHILPLDEQVELATALVEAGADIIQTEGGTSSTPVHSGTLGLIEKATPTLAAASSISQAVSVPVLCASGLSKVTIPMAIAAGASGVGVGSAVNQLDDEVAMIATVRGLVEALSTVQHRHTVRS